jgi:hypothetical protein
MPDQMIIGNHSNKNGMALLLTSSTFEAQVAFQVRAGHATSLSSNIVGTFLPRASKGTLGSN